ncbi:hypothetical protein [Brachybacterium aquaticum]|uniref:Uncharacterized protein n=1 Tax=Brachybacterium aquaticum TaxID=1432564 RepID=A0A841ABY0_9MICO|nr:hypothetical protein [Brachybacterium aquaticum]MBB5831447.1 hypothetical protein [Brachybacterium aquaticum]
MTSQRPSFNPPPNWPEPPHDGWVPPADFRPSPAWGPVPAGWRLWRSDRPGTTGAAPLQDSEDVPASGARPRSRVEQYPVSVLNPGMWSQNHLQDEDYGFPPAKPRRHRPRLRLGLTITATALGLLLTAATVVMFVLLVDFAIEDLAGMLEGTAGSLSSAHIGSAGISTTGISTTVTALPEVGAAAPARG